MELDLTNYKEILEEKIRQQSGEIKALKIKLKYAVKALEFYDLKEGQIELETSPAKKTLVLIKYTG